eukprot:gene10531-19258_t
MAESKSFLNVPKNDDKSLSNESTDNKGLFASIGRRVSKMVTSFKLETPKYDNVKLKQMPGNCRMSLFGPYHMSPADRAGSVNLARISSLSYEQGLAMLNGMVEQYHSRVFRYPFGRPSTIVCEAEAICESSCNASQVYKEPIMGHKEVNLDLIGKHVPCIFTNDFMHSKSKAFIIGFVSVVAKYYLLPTLVEMVPFVLESWEMEGPIGDLFEEKVTKLVATIYSRSFLGIELKYEFVKLWNKEIFKPQRSSKRCKEAYQAIYRIIEDCPRYEEMLLIASKFKIKENDMINEVIFALLFNAIPLTSHALISAIARLVTITGAMKEQIKVEGEQHMQSGIDLKAIAKLFHLENFILEVLRLNPPAPLIFGVVRSTYVLFSSSGNFTMNEGDCVVGNIFGAHRDPEIFTDPCQFEPSRFTNDCLKDSLLSFGGRHTDEPKSSNRKCPGQDIAMVILKMCLLNLMECELKFSAWPTFENARLQRSGMPDNPLALRHFKFNLPHWWKDSDPNEDRTRFCRRLSEISENTSYMDTTDECCSNISFPSLYFQQVLLRDRKDLLRLVDRDAASYHSASLNSSLSEVNIH